MIFIPEIYKAFYENEKQLLTESVESVLMTAIQKHEYVYLYYSGKDTKYKGYRTVMPFTIGYLGTGNKSLRAWQINGSSDTFKGGTGKRRRYKHEYFTKKDGYEKWYPDSNKFQTNSTLPGWRLFLIDDITNVIPTGKFFDVNKNGFPYKYNPNDRQMTNGIIISLNPKDAEKNTNIEKNDSIKLDGAPDVYNLTNFVEIIKKYWKKSPKNFFVVKQGDDYYVKDRKYLGKYTTDNILGNILDLIDEYKKEDNNNDDDDQEFFDREKEKL